MTWRVAMFVVALLVAAGDATAFCVENAIAGRVAQVSVVAAGPQRPARLWSSPAETNKQVCCNPRNLECNPNMGLGGDDAVVHFAARVEAAANQPAATCGAFIDERQRILYAPARGYLRFEPNRAFVPQRRASVVNAPFVARVLDADRKPITDLPCL